MRVNNIFETILASQGGYLAERLHVITRDNKQHYQFTEALQDAPKKLRWLILGREHYFETSKEYPISNVKELKQALRFDENKAPFDGRTLQRIERIDEQSHRVTFWVIPESVFETLDSVPWLMLPESFLLAKIIDSDVNIAEFERLNKAIFVSNSGKGLFSGVQSLHVPDLEAFAFSTGSAITPAQHAVRATPYSFIELLISGMKKLSASDLQAFFIRANKPNFKDYPLKSAVSLSIFVFSLYLILSSGWLVYKEYRLTSEFEKNSAHVNDSLLSHKSYKNELEWQKQLLLPTANAEPYWRVWPIVLDAISVGATLKAISYKDRTVTLNGTAKLEVKATDILAQLSKLPEVESASFSQPVRKYRNRDEFVISFSFASPAVEQSKADKK